jgi:tetratricopeptide (TPR) repeat protein
VTEDKQALHNRLFEEAAAIAKGEILLHERSNMPPPGWWLRRKLSRALNLFDQVLAINPGNYSALWLAGKVHQRLGDQEQSFLYLERAYQANPSQPDVAREVSMAAMNLGRHDAAIAYSFRAVQIEPANHGLQANLALAYLLAGSLPEAQKAIAVALAGDPNDKISQTIAKTISHFVEINRRPPATTPELISYWQKRLKDQKKSAP